MRSPATISRYSRALTPIRAARQIRSPSRFRPVTRPAWPCSDPPLIKGREEACPLLRRNDGPVTLSRLWPRPVPTCCGEDVQPDHAMIPGMLTLWSGRA